MVEWVAYPGIDPLAPQEFMDSATQIRFIMNFTSDCPDWKTTRYRIINELDEYLEGMWDILLGDPEKFTDNSAEFVLYVESRIAEKATHYVEHRRAK